MDVYILQRCANVLGTKVSLDTPNLDSEPWNGYLYAITWLLTFVPLQCRTGRDNSCICLLFPQLRAEPSQGPYSAEIS